MRKLVLNLLIITALFLNCDGQDVLSPAAPPISRRIKIEPSVWVGKYEEMKDRRHLLAQWLLTGSSTDEVKYQSKENVEYEGYDGWYNNLARPDLGAIDRPLLRRWPAAYADGVYEPTGQNRPNPLNLSESLLAGPIGSRSRTGKNALLVFFGQQVVEEILDAQRPACPPEYFNIEVPKSHRYYEETGHTQLPVLRTRYDMRTGYSPNNPRQQLNEITPYLDGGLIYGTTKSWADYLRKYNDSSIDPDGKLASKDREGLFPEVNYDRLPMANPPPPFHHAEIVRNQSLLPVSRFFKLGNPRGNENTFLLTFGILWFRWHNYIATSIKKNNLDWSGEKIFNEARKWVIATQQHIVINIWLREWLGEELEPYKKYDPSIDPQIDQFFQTAAMRFGHTLVVPGVYLRDYGRKNCTINFRNWNQNAVRTCNSFWRPQDAITAKDNDGGVMDIDRLLMGMSVQLCEEEDHKIVEDLRGNVFGPLEFSRRDLMAINIQRARDHGIPDYNTARKAYNLTRVNAISHFPYVDQTIVESMIEQYDNNWDNIDIWVGGIMETGDNPGELFRAIISDQFRRIRDGDRFWFENLNNGLFTPAEINRIKELNVYDIIMAVTKMDSDDIPRNPFRVPSTRSEIHSQCQEILEMSRCTFSRSVNPKPPEDCYHLPLLTAARLNENCTITNTFDYFSNSEVSFILSFLAVSLSIGGLTIFAWWYSKNELKKPNNVVQQIARSSFASNIAYQAKERNGDKNSFNSIVIILNSIRRQIQVNTPHGIITRAIDFSNRPTAVIDICIASDNLHLMLNIEHEYSLVLQFESESLRENFLQALERYIDEIGIGRQRINLALKPMLKQAITKADRQKKLDMFFRVVFAQAFRIDYPHEEILNVNSALAQGTIYTELTISEFADSLSMSADSEFVRRIFALIDRDGNGFVSFREFLDFLFIFAKGSGREKAKLLFDMYDIDKLEYLTEKDFKNMIRSLMETVRANVKPEDLEVAVQAIINQDRKLAERGMSFEDFYRIFQDDIDIIGNVNIEFANATQAGRSNTRGSYIDQAVDEIENLYLDPRELENRIGGNGVQNIVHMIDEEQDRVINTIKKRPHTILRNMTHYIETNMRQIFWVSLYTIILLAIFIERAYYYSVEREHSGLRRIAGYGVTVTRGAASAMMFTYSTLLLTMCRNTISILRDTFLNHFIDFDKSIQMHKYIACWALIFTIMHIIGHAFNFYHISTQTADDLTCLFRNYFHATHELPKFHYWCWQTMTGFTGIVLTIICAIIYISAIPGISRGLFWIGHALYPLFFVFMILHGTGRLIQEPFFPYFLVGPLFLFIMDMLISVSRKKIKIRVISAEILPSEVTKLEIKRPSNFEYKSGQWVRIACSALNSSEFHPFTLSSSPNESNLTVHIRAVGPWTRAIRQVYKDIMDNPRIYLDGPFGEGHQDWFRYDVSVLIGGGIGVTPFASILKDIVFRSNVAHRSHCKKVYFIWVTKTQRQFEWLVDIIRQVEMSDLSQTVSIHLYITQFYQKFDLRTTLLYICERHFQRIAGKSLFTGLRAVTHFGRPKFPEFLKGIRSLHPEVQKVGVFSCGPPPMTASVENACVQVNKFFGAVTFHHLYKNF